MVAIPCSYSEATIWLEYRRASSTPVWDIFAPMCMLVILSWTSYAIPVQVTAEYSGIVRVAQSTRCNMEPCSGMYFEHTHTLHTWMRIDTDAAGDRRSA